jgi:micrococcal nuclease
MGRTGHIAVATLLPLVSGATDAVAAPVAWCAAPAGPVVAVSSVPAPFELELADGTRVRIVDIGLAMPGEGEAAARSALQALVSVRSVRLDAAAPILDRYGRRVTRVALDDGSDLGARLVAAGVALVGAAPRIAADGPCRHRLLAAEAAARRERRGLWADGTFRVEDAADPLLATRAGRFALVQGRIVGLGKAGRTRYLNFGRRWSLDFTATIAESDGTWPRGWGIGPDALQGAHVRVRGWLESDDGGLVRLARPEDLERIDADHHGDDRRRRGGEGE